MCIRSAVKPSGAEKIQKLYNTLGSNNLRCDIIIVVGIVAIVDGKESPSLQA